MKKLLFLLFLSSLVACARPPYVVPDSVDTSHIMYDDSSSVVNPSTSTSNVGGISTSLSNSNNKVDLESLNYISTCDFFNRNHNLYVVYLYDDLEEYPIDKIIEFHENGKFPIYLLDFNTYDFNLTDSKEDSITNSINSYHIDGIVVADVPSLFVVCDATVADVYVGATDVGAAVMRNMK